ncbi:MAG TPA: type II toxin-antitoxin system HicB family antitoxin [Candidatus Thermoplasmatota archaeon]|nr:type II toxin-antitoxin system HicB family antitoxin [Candidatus Thermoplasmatota archaeon]
MEFTVILEEGESGFIVANVPQLPGCHTQGRTKAEAMRHVREAIELYLSVKAPAATITVERIRIEA